MNDELIEQVNLVRYKLEEAIKEYASLKNNISNEEAEHIEKHIKVLQSFSSELYKMFI